MGVCFSFRLSSTAFWNSGDCVAGIALFSFLLSLSSLKLDSLPWEMIVYVVAEGIGFGDAGLLDWWIAGL